ncbi:MAG: PDZ domain-containing protein [Bacteroidota bacterium]
MKRYFLKAAGTLMMFGLIATTTRAQDEKNDIIKHHDDVIVIRPKTDADTKLTIEIKGDEVKVNGKPLADYKNDDVTISRRKQVTVDNRRLSEMDAMEGPRTRFRSDPDAFNYGGGTNMDLFSTNTNKAFLGVGTEKAAEGVTISSVSDNSGAEKAGLKKGDVITKINDTKIVSPAELTKTIGKFNPNDKITITYKRDKKEQKTAATLSKRKSGPSITYAPQQYKFKDFDLNNGFNYNFPFNGKAKLGLRAQETEDGKGLKVVGVDDESPAEKAGIKEGDTITSFDGTEVNNIDALRELAKPAMEKHNFKIKLTRDGKQQEVEIKIPKNLKTTSL